MPLRGHTPASEPFRKIGKYDAEQSTNPIAKGVIDELKTLREGMRTYVAQHIM